MHYCQEQERAGMSLIMNSWAAVMEESGPMSIAFSLHVSSPSKQQALDHEQL
jgi:hypothetical protein